MNSTKIIAIAAAFATISSFAGLKAQAAESAPELTMKPLGGVSFDVGSKRAVSYFLSEKGTCKLVLTIADTPNLDGMPTLTATRFEASVPAVGTTRYDAVGGEAVEFACHEGAQSMSVRLSERVAGTAGR